MEITVNKPLAETFGWLQEVTSWVPVRAAFSSWRIRALPNMRSPSVKAPAWTWSSSGRHPGKGCPTTMSG